MTRARPSFNLFRTFEAAARHGHFGRAAEELHVTQSAVSHQIRDLEQQLETQLFDRGAAGVTLTARGAALFPTVQQSLLAIGRAVDGLRDPSAGGTLRISPAPAFAARWLVPNLETFISAHPEIGIDLRPANDPGEAIEPGTDVAIRYGQPVWEGCRIELLTKPSFFPVLNPRLINGPYAIRQPSDLLRFRLLHGDDGGDWRRWFAEAEVGAAADLPGIHLSQANLAIRAAIAGCGVALGDDALAGPELARGQLVRPLKQTIPARSAYYLAVPNPSAERPAVEVFRAWLRRHFH